MKSKGLAAASAALLSLSLMAGTPVLAQGQLDDAVNAQLVGLGFQPSGWMLTEQQRIELQNVLSSNETDDTKQAQVRQIVGDAAMPTQVPDQPQLPDAVNARLVGLGFQPSGWNLTEQQQIELQNVLSSSESDDIKQAQVRQIVGDAAGPVEMPPQPQLPDSVNSQLVGLGFTPSDWTLTQEQQIELQNLLSSNENMDTKRAQVRQIVGIN